MKRKLTFQQVQEPWDCKFLNRNLYRWKDLDPGKDSLAPRPKLRRTLKRPFVTGLGETDKISDFYIGRSGRPVVHRTWYHGVGCSVFDGLCINQEEFEKIDCLACIKSTFESFIKGCPHRVSPVT